MTTNNMRPIHPGEILREEYLRPLDMTPNALSIHLRVPASRINELVFNGISLHKSISHCV